MTQHPYADILRAIADGEAVQWQDSVGVWHEQDVNPLLAEIADDRAYPPGRYRRKPRTIRIGEFDVPEPLRVAPATDTTVYRACPVELWLSSKWYDSPHQRTALARGLLHSSAEAAELHAQALLSLTAPQP